MSETRQLRYGNLVPESAIQAVALQVLGQRLYHWSESTSPRLCQTFDNRLSDLNDAGNRIRAELDELALGDFDVPLDSEGKELMSRVDYKRQRESELDRRNAENIASLDKLTTIYLKLTAGGIGAMLQGMKQANALDNPAVTPSGERNVTERRRFGAGRALVVDAST